MLDVADRIRFRLCVHSPRYLAELCRPVSNIDSHRHLQSAGRIRWPWPARCSASQTVNLQRIALWHRTFSLERSSWLFKKMMHFLCLPLDVSLNISTSHFTSTPSAFKDILHLMRYMNYLLQYGEKLMPLSTVVPIDTVHVGTVRRDVVGASTTNKLVSIHQRALQWAAKKLQRWSDLACGLIGQTVQRLKVTDKDSQLKLHCIMIYI